MKELKDTEMEKNDYEERLETKLKELKDIEAEWDACKQHLVDRSNELAIARTEANEYEKRLAASQKLLTTAAIGDQLVFPPLGTGSAVRILDRRGMGKKDYLLNLLEQKQPTIIYVQSEEMVDLLLERVIPEKADLIEKHSEHTSEAEERGVLEKLENGEKIAVVSDTTLSSLVSSHCIEHFVFCHLVLGLDEFFRQCEPAFTSEKNVYLHLIHESKQNVEELVEKYPNEEALRKLYQKFRDCTPTEGTFIDLENLYGEFCKDRELNMTKLGIETSFSIFEELGFLELNKKNIRRLSATSTKLEASKIYCRGKKLRKEIADSPAFQYEQSIEQIWKEILKKLNIDSEQIIRRLDIREMSSKDSEIEDDAQSIRAGEDRITPPTLDMWPQRGVSPFGALRQQAAKITDNTDSTWGRERRELSRPSYYELPKRTSAIWVERMHKDELQSTVIEEEARWEDSQNKYNLAMQFAQEHGINALEQGIAQLTTDQSDPNYDFTEDEVNMLHAFQEALKDFQTRSEQSTEVVETNNTVGDEDTEASQTPKPARTNAKVTEEQVREIRSRSATGESNSELAKEFNLSPTAVRDIVQRNTWKDVE